MTDTRPWFDHIGIAVPDLRSAARLVTSALGGEFHRGGDNHDYGFRTAQFGLRGAGKIELLQPIDPASDLQRFLDERGPGVHHITFLAEDVVDTERHLHACGYRTTGTQIVDDAHWRETYLGPSQGLGTIIQLGETDLDWRTPWPDFDLEDVLTGRVVWHGALQRRARD